MRRRTQIAVVIGFLALLLAPAAALLLGRSATAFENRPLTAAPDISPGNLLSLRTFEGLDGYITDHLPFRVAAVRAVSWLDYRLFRDSRTPVVGVGHGDWLFLRKTVRTCDGVYSPDDAVEELRLAERVARTAGRELWALIAPDKIWIYPDQAGGLRDEWDCARERDRALRAAVEQAAREGWMAELWSPLERGRAGGLMFHAQDTHFTDLGRVVMVRTLIDRIRPGVWHDEDVALTGTEDHTGDLAALMGLSMTLPADTYALARPGVAVAPVRLLPEPGTTDVAAGITVAASAAVGSPRRPVLPGLTVVVGDSQMGFAVGYLSAFLEQARYAPWNQVGGGRVAVAAGAADRLVVEAAERELDGYVVEDKIHRLLGPIVEGLAGAPLRVSRPGGAVAHGVGELAVPAGVTALTVGGPSGPENRDRLLIVRMRSLGTTYVELARADGTLAPWVGAHRLVTKGERVAWLLLPAGERLSHLPLLVVTDTGATVSAVEVLPLAPRRRGHAGVQARGGAG